MDNQVWPPIPLIFTTTDPVPDWTRYAKTPNASLFGQGVTAPLTIIITAICGSLVTSAAYTIYGEYFWNPFELLLYIQKGHMSSAARAGTFFSGLCFLASQMALCIVLNAISTGMDMAALCPKWINIRRGCFILTIIAVAVCPWNYVNAASTFITVLSGWSVFLSGMTGILISDYFLVRRCQLHIGDMYVSDPEGAYWYTAGFNWRAFAAWTMGLWPLLREYPLPITPSYPLSRAPSSLPLPPINPLTNAPRSRLRPPHPRHRQRQRLGPCIRHVLLLRLLRVAIRLLVTIHCLPHQEAARQEPVRHGAAPHERRGRGGAAKGELRGRTRHVW